MGNGIIGKFLYYWIFIIGALVFAKVLNLFHSDKQLIWFLRAVSIVYIIWTVFRSLGNRKREEKKAAAAQPNVVHKGRNKKRHK